MKEKKTTDKSRKASVKAKRAPASPKKAAAPGRQPAARAATPKAAASRAERTYDAIVVGGGHNGLVNGAYLAKAGLQHADPRAAPPRRRRGDHRGAAPRLLVHHLLVRALAAPAADRPRAGARQARLHAAAHVVHLRPDGERRLPLAEPGPRPEPQGDRPPQQAGRRRLRAVHARHGHGLPGAQAAARPGAARPLQRRPGGAVGPRGTWAAVQADGQAHPPQRRAAADRQRRRLPRRLLRVRDPQGLPRELEHHRHQGRAALAGLGPRAALPLAGRARRRVRRLGLPQEGQRRVHAGARPRGAGVRGRDPPRGARRPR